jgi:hypothetical protein
LASSNISTIILKKKKIKISISESGDISWKLSLSNAQWYWGRKVGRGKGDNERQ